MPHDLKWPVQRQERQGGQRWGVSLCFSFLLLGNKSFPEASGGGLVLWHVTGYNKANLNGGGVLRKPFCWEAGEDGEVGDAASWQPAGTTSRRPAPTPLAFTFLWTCCCCVLPWVTESFLLATSWQGLGAGDLYTLGANWTWRTNGRRRIYTPAPSSLSGTMLRHTSHPFSEVPGGKMILLSTEVPHLSTHPDLASLPSLSRFPIPALRFSGIIFPTNHLYSSLPLELASRGHPACDTGYVNLLNFSCEREIRIFIWVGPLGGSMKKKTSMKTPHKLPSIHETQQ